MRSALTYILLLLILCAISFGLGIRHGAVAESTETIIKLDTVYIPSPPPPTEAESAEPKIAYLMRCDTITRTLHDTVLVYVPMLNYTFEVDSLYKIEAHGYDVSLTSVELYNRNTTTLTTLRSPIRRWSMNAEIGSLSTLGETRIFAGLNIDYTLSSWVFTGGYQIDTQGNGGVELKVKRRLLSL